MSLTNLVLGQITAGFANLQMVNVSTFTIKLQLHTGEFVRVARGNSRVDSSS